MVDVDWHQRDLLFLKVVKLSVLLTVAMISINVFLLILCWIFFAVVILKEGLVHSFSAKHNVTPNKSFNEANETPLALYEF